MSLLQEYQKNWLNIKDDVYFVIDNTILKYGLKLGYSDNDIKQEILKNSPQLKNMPKEYTINYLSKLQGNNLNLNQKDTSIPNDSFNYKKACNSLSEAFINFYAKKEISVANKLLDKNYPNLDIQNVIKNHSPFFSDFKNILPNTSHVNYVNAIMNKFPTQLTNLQYKDHLNIYLKLAKIEQAKNNNVFNSYVDFKLALTLYFDKNIPMNSIKKIFSEATLNKNIKQKELLEKFYSNLNKAELSESLQNKKDSENRYIKTIQKIEEEIKNSISKISFFIKSDDNSEIFKEVFKNSLNKKSYKVVEKKDSENIYEIDLSSNQSKIRPSGFFIIENILNIKVKDKNNRQLSSKTIELKGASSNNFDDAKINLIQKLKKYEEQNSILPFE